MDKHTLPMRRRKNGKAHFLVPVAWTPRLVLACDRFMVGYEGWSPTSYAIEMDADGGKDICKRCLARIEKGEVT